MWIYFGVDVCHCDDVRLFQGVWELCLAAPPGVDERAAVCSHTIPALLLKCILIVCNTVSEGSQAFTGEARFHAASFQYPQKPTLSLPPPPSFFPSSGALQKCTFQKGNIYLLCEKNLNTAHFFILFYLCMCVCTSFFIILCENQLESIWVLRHGSEDIFAGRHNFRPLKRAFLRIKTWLVLRSDAHLRCLMLEMCVFGSARETLQEISETCNILGSLLPWRRFW